MSEPLFVKSPSFPSSKCSFTPAGFFWKVQVREWAFAQVDLQGVDADQSVTSNTPDVVPGSGDTTEQCLTVTRKGGNLTVRFLALAKGFTFIQLLDKAGKLVIDPGLQVEVLERRAPAKDKLSLTKLEGNTVAFNAPDTVFYAMDTNLTWHSMSIGPSFFSGVKPDTNHVVISAHGDVPTGLTPKEENLCLFVAGKHRESIRLDIDNVEDVFKALKGQVAKDCVIWFGGCKIGSNNKFCSKAAVASGCTVVAPAMPLLTKRYPKLHVETLDRFAVPKVFEPDGNLVEVADFCGKQDTHQFVVPV
jgi:hypothetical protein